MRSILLLVITALFCGCVNMTGKWVGTVDDTSLGQGSVKMRLLQQGQSISGLWSATFENTHVDLAGVISGMVSGDMFTATLTPSDIRYCAMNAMGSRSRNTLSGTYTVVQCWETATASFALLRDTSKPVPPTAYFTATPLSGKVPLTVNFHDESDPGDSLIASWQWDFGDGANSNLQNPAHEYVHPGSYTVRLEVATPDGESATIGEQSITVIQPEPPAAAFDGEPRSGVAPLTTQFTEHSTPGTAPITDRLWTFGDGGTSRETNPSHAYLQAGTYDVSLTVTTVDGQDTETLPGYVVVEAGREGEGEGEGEGEAEVVALSVGLGEGKVGDTIDIPVVLQNGLRMPSQILFQVQYNSDRLAFEGLTPGAAAEEAGKDVNAFVSAPGKVVFIVSGLNTDIVNSGEILVARFKILSGTTDEVLPLAASHASLLDSEGESIEVVLTDGHIRINADGGGEVATVVAYLVLDYTLSMADRTINGDLDQNGRSDAIDAMETAAKDIFLDGLTQDAEVGIYEFHREDCAPMKVADFSTDRDYLKGRIDAIWAEYVQDFPAGSRCWDALFAATQEFADDPEAEKDEQRAIIFLSNGRDESSAHTYSDVIEQAQMRSITLYCIGFGAEPDLTTLQMITSQTHGKCYSASAAEELADRFERITWDLGGGLPLPEI